MDVLSILRLLTRHWRVTAPAALITVLLIGVALRSSSPMYEATGSVVLLPPPEAPDVSATGGSAPAPEVGQNPFARYGDLSVVADILARVLGGESSRDEFESLGVTGYEVVVNKFQRGPVVDVTGQGPNAEAAIRSAEIVLKEVDVVLSGLQQAEHADPDYFIRSASVERPSTATTMYGSTVRTAIAALAVGALGTLSLAVLAEAITRRREARPTAAAGSDTSGAANPGTDAGVSNGSRRAGWSGILSTKRFMRGEPAQQHPAQQKSARQVGSKRQSAWQKVSQQNTAEEPSGESPSENGNRRPTTDWSP
jgi:hypothetical protein